MTFDDILANCIEALEQGATIQECVTRYPAHATALESLLRLTVALSQESQTRLSAQAFQRGRQQVMAQAQQQRANHRQPVDLPARRHAQPSPYAQNGLPPRQPQTRRVVTTARPWNRVELPRLLRTALLLMMLLGATTLFRQVMMSRPGTTFYAVKSTGEQLVGVLMVAAGEGIAWHATQAERHLQELAQLADPDVATVQTLSGVVETHWNAMLLASERLPASERRALLQSHIARLQQLITTWSATQTGAPPPALATARKLITAGEAALDRPSQLENPITVVETSTATATPFTPAPPTPTVTPTPLLQASATSATTLPILVPSPTPTASPTFSATVGALAVPTTEIVNPTEPVSAPPALTPLPALTVQMPQQESDNQHHDDEDQNDNDNSAEAATATATPLSEEPADVTPVPPTAIITSGEENVTATIEPNAATATPLSPANTEAPVPPAPGNQTPLATIAVENTPAIPTKTAPSATSVTGPTPEAPTAGTARPTNQSTPTKTPKPTATHGNGATATPDAASNATAVPPTAVENTPNATSQPTTQPTTPQRDDAVQTPGSLLVTPVAAQPTKRPAAPGNEPTKVAQP